ncbi:hypothetical protein JMUB6875_45750 [Nocardia sp. JMUB6875]
MRGTPAKARGVAEPAPSPHVHAQNRGVDAILTTIGVVVAAGVAGAAYAAFLVLRGRK